eukprot:CAMPEP_0185028538 /NCGR_PEP_ID=MMETSP1103-20130426/14310_1 /TAXON_ID=36769 /ORGANISM="Paraphysomonas bandaiensis, Strain Caron Lab Isolate" /LENGTH=140 /DNA_ID=CAMNT_0027562981 /DNA_START=37 /DNA_END=459 /DNA_ORIENTATION=+
MIGHGKSDDTATRKLDEYRRAAESTCASIEKHSNVKRDFWMSTQFPLTTAKLLSYPDDTPEKVVRESKFIAREYSFSRKLMMYYKWFAAKSSMILSKKPPETPGSSVYPVSELSDTLVLSCPQSRGSTFRTNIVFPEPAY